nr:immunoglobulin light chain junction region [Macaca mulatta]
CQQGYTFPFTF